MRVLKYQPYRGYGAGKPWHHYGHCQYAPFPRRIRTKGDWRWDCRPVPEGEHAYHLLTGRWGRAEMIQCRACGQVHCSVCRCYRPWKKRDDTGGGGSVYEKRLAHHTFRRWCRRAIAQELALITDDEESDVSHAFRYYGTWLD